MPSRRRTVECRLVVVAFVDLTSPDLGDALMELPDGSALAAVVAEEIQANLESVDYIADVAIGIL